jgi:hypothetical protein
MDHVDKKSAERKNDLHRIVKEEQPSPVDMQ